MDSLLFVITLALISQFTAQGVHVQRSADDVAQIPAAELEEVARLAGVGVEEVAQLPIAELEEVAQLAAGGLEEVADLPATELEEVAQLAALESQDDAPGADMEPVAFSEVLLAKPSEKTATRTGTNMLLSPRVSALQSLTTDLKTSYDRDVIPGNVTVYVSLALPCLNFYPAGGHLSANSHESFHWSDERLRWNPEDYNGIKWIVLNSRSVWLPDIALTKSYVHYECRYGPSVHVGHTGRIYWFTNTRYWTTCTNSTTEEETYDCVIEYASWMHSANELKLELNRFGAIHVYDEPDIPQCTYKAENAKARIRVFNFEFGNFETFQATFTIRPKVKEIE